MPEHKVYSSIFTGTGNGTTVDLRGRPLTYWAIQVKGTGAAATAWDVRLEVSIDGVNFFEINAHATGDGDGFYKYSSTAMPAQYVRSRCDTLTLGSATNIVSHILGMES